MKSQFMANAESFAKYVQESVENDTQKRKAAIMITLEETDNGADCQVGIMGKEDMVMYGLYKFLTTPGVKELLKGVYEAMELMNKMNEK